MDTETETIEPTCHIERGACFKSWIRHKSRCRVNESIKFLKVLAELIDSEIRDKVSEIRRAAKKP